MRFRKCSLLQLVIGAVAAPLMHADIMVTVQNLVSNQPGVATFQDSRLVNSWGLATSGTGPFWVGDNGSGLATVYDTAGMPNAAAAVSIQGAGTVTGVTFTGGGGFNGDLFLFASEDGTVSGWRPALGLTGIAERLQVADPGNSYKGITYASTGGFAYSYLANFAQGRIEVLKGDPQAPNLPGTFLDPGLPAGYSPFNVQNLSGTLYVTYALKSGNDEVPGPGQGIVDRFDLNGILLGRVAAGGDLNAPWGLALAPAGFLGSPGALLVGNFGDGTIHAYDALTGKALGTFVDSSSNPVMIDGLWGLRFGNGGQGGDFNALYFTAGPGAEINGLLGRIDAVAATAVPEPGSLLFSGTAILLLLWRYRPHAM